MYVQYCVTDIIIILDFYVSHIQHIYMYMYMCVYVVVIIHILHLAH